MRKILVIEEWSNRSLGGTPGAVYRSKSKIVADEDKNYISLRRFEDMKSCEDLVKIIDENEIQDVFYMLAKKHGSKQEKDEAEYLVKHGFRPTLTDDAIGKFEKWIKQEEPEAKVYRCFTDI